MLHMKILLNVWMIGKKKQNPIQILMWLHYSIFLLLIMNQGRLQLINLMMKKLILICMDLLKINLNVLECADHLYFTSLFQLVNMLFLMKHASIISKITYMKTVDHMQIPVQFYVACVLLCLLCTLVCIAVVQKRRIKKSLKNLQEISNNKDIMETVIIIQIHIQQRDKIKIKELILMRTMKISKQTMNMRFNRMIIDYNKKLIFD